MRNRLLLRQVKKKLGIDASNASSALETLSEQASAELLRRLPEFFAAVEESYEAFERDLALRSRSLELSSSELVDLNDRLRDEVSSKQLALDSLHATLEQLLPRGAASGSAQQFDIKAASAQIQQLVQERESSRQAALAAQHAAEEASTAKSQFLAKMSHELRTPMNAIIGMTELVMDSPLNAEQQQLTSCVFDAANSLLTILNDILDFSKMEVGHLVLHESNVDLRSLVEDSVRLLRPKAAEKQLELVVDVAADVPQNIIGDSGRIQQVLVNLLSNAIKFTHTGSVRLTLGRDPTRPQYVRFAVRDTGVGIPDSQRHLIWNAFSQGDNSNSRQFGGTGLGLAICSHLVKMMGGDIELSSQVGKGSTFSFSVPPRVVRPTELAVSPSRPQPTSGSLVPVSLRRESHRQPGAGQHVLLVEDNETNQQLAVRILQKLGCTVDVAEDGERALQRFEDSDYDVIFMDLQMPRLDGIAATRLIRERELARGGHVPIVALTANVAPGDREDCIEAGMDYYVSKPVRIAAVQDALARARSMDFAARA